MPKVELHCHLEGSVPASTAIALARRNNVALPTTDPDRLYQFTDLEGFLDIYRAVSRAMATPADFATVTYDSLTDAAASSHLIYREIAFNPTNHPGLDLADMLAGISDGIESARADHGVTARVIVAINREQPPETARQLISEVIRVDHPLVVGVGLDHNERLGAPGMFVDAFRMAAAAGLRRTAHAGERGDAGEVAATIGELGVDRVDHGYAVLADPALIRRSKDAGIHYAACWSTSAFHDSDGASSPIPAMLAAGLDVSISSDDPPLFGTDVGAEYVQAGARLGWAAATARERVLGAARATFLAEGDRNALIDSVTARFDSFDRQFLGPGGTDQAGGGR